MFSLKPLLWEPSAFASLLLKIYIISNLVSLCQESQDVTVPCAVKCCTKKPAISHDFMDERLSNLFPPLPPLPQAFQTRLKRTAGRRLWEGELNLIFSVLNRPNYDFWSLSDMNSFSGNCVQDWISAMWFVLTKYRHKCGWKLPGSQRTDGDLCPNHKQESCSLADTVLGSCWVKAALYQHPRKGNKRGKGRGEWVYNMELMKSLRLAEGFQNLASNI